MVDVYEEVELFFKGEKVTLPELTTLAVDWALMQIVWKMHLSIRCVLSSVQIILSRNCSCVLVCLGVVLSCVLVICAGLSCGCAFLHGAKHLVFRQVFY